MDPAVLAAIIAAFGGVVGYLGLVRRLSGRIATTEAGRLWEEADRMRHEYREEIARMQGVIDRYEKRLQEIEQRNTKLAKENYALTEKVKECEATIGKLKAELSDLSLENQRVRTEADAYRSRLMELEIDTHG